MSVLLRRPRCLNLDVKTRCAVPGSSVASSIRRRWISSSPIYRSERDNAKAPESAKTREIDRPAVQVKHATTQLKDQIKSKLQRNLKHENIYTLPNVLTFSRLLATPAIGYLILTDAHVWAVGLFVYAGFTDLVDGWIARRWNQQSVVGSVIDPMADKTLMTVLTVCLAVKGALPVSIATLILGRDVSLSIAAIYYRYASLPPPKTLARYWDFSLPSAQVHPTTISKWNTTLQLMLIGATTALPLVCGPAAIVPLSEIAGVAVPDLMTAFQWTVAGTTVWSGLSYLYSRNAVEVLRDDLTAQQKRNIIRRGRGVIGLCFLGCLGVAFALEQ